MFHPCLFTGGGAGAVTASFLALSHCSSSSNTAPSSKNTISNTRISNIESTNKRTRSLLSSPLACWTVGSFFSSPPVECQHHPSVSLGSHMHGKGLIRVVKVDRSSKNQRSKHFSVESRLYGNAVAASYTDGVNTNVVATDTQRNTVYVLARQHPLLSKEQFAALLASHFVAQYPQGVERSSISITEDYWERVSTHNDAGSLKPHHHAFQKRGPEQGFVTVDFANDGSLRVVSGLRDITLLKLTQSGWSEFIRDKFTALPETTERLLASAMDIEWEFDLCALGRVDHKYNDAEAVAIPRNISSRVPVDELEKVLSAPDFDAINAQIETVLRDAFCGPPETGVFSKGVQETLFKMGCAVLESDVGSALKSVKLRAPNLHNIPAQLPGGVANVDHTGYPDVFVATTEPHGIIEVEVSHKDAPSENSVTRAALTASSTATTASSTSSSYNNAYTASANINVDHDPGLLPSRKAFLQRFGGVYEKSPWIAERAWPPHAYVNGLRMDAELVGKLLKTVVDGSSDREKLELLRAHPDLGGKLAVATFKGGAGGGAGEERLTTESQREQKGAGLDQCSPKEFEEFQSMNKEYVGRYGFPYILAVSGRNRQQILENFRSRVGRPVEVEFLEAIEQVHRIAAIRIGKIFDGTA